MNAHAPVQLNPGDAIVIDGVQRLVVENRTHEPPGYEFRPAMGGSIMVWSDEQIASAYNAKRIEFVARSAYQLPIGIQQSLKRSLSSFDGTERAEVMRRLRYVRALDALPADFSRSDKALAPVIAPVAEKLGEKAPRWTTVYGWWGKWVMSGRDARSLCPLTKRRGNREPKMANYVYQAIEHGIRKWLQPHRPSAETIHGEVIRRIREIHKGPGEPHYPSVRTVTCHIRKVSRVKRLYHRYGPEAARNEMYPVGAGPVPTFPLEHVEVDWKFLRVFVVDEKHRLPLGKPVLIVAIDRLTRVIVGFYIGFEPPSWHSAAQCLKNCVLFKDLSWAPTDEYGDSVIRHVWPVNGVPATFFVDNEMAWHSESFKDTAQALRCSIDVLPPHAPTLKGVVERFNDTIQQGALDLIPGRTFRPSDRKAEKDPADLAVVSLDELRLLVTKWIVDIYHYEFNEGLGDFPIKAWEREMARRAVTPLPPHGSIVELVGEVEWRTPDNRGVRLFGLRYNSPDFAKFRDARAIDRKVKVKYDPGDISTIIVIDEKSGDTLHVPCTRQDYARDLTLHQHLVIKRRAKDELGKEGGRLHMRQLFEAKAELHALADQLIRSRKRKGSRNRLARYLGVGREVLDQLSSRIYDPEASGDPVGFFDEDIADDADKSRSRRPKRMPGAGAAPSGRSLSRLPAPPPEPKSITALPLIREEIPPASETGTVPARAEAHAPSVPDAEPSLAPPAAAPPQPAAPAPAPAPPDQPRRRTTRFKTIDL